jgi:hypothetical protein
MVGVDVWIGDFSVFGALQYQSVGLCCSQLTSIYRQKNPKGAWDGTVEVRVKTFLFVPTSVPATFDLVLQPGVRIESG